MQVGIDSFAAAYDDASLAVSASERLRNLVEQIEHADQAGRDSFGVGEHHRREYLDSAPAIILAAAASRTQRIRLTSSVTVLGAADPVRVFQEFATLDLLSQGRAEIVVGRGSFVDAFPLFGFPLEDYDSLFAEKLELLLNSAKTSTSAGLASTGPEGALLIGSAEEVVEKIARHGQALGGIARITFQMNASSLPHAKLMRAIEAIGTKVAPALHAGKGSPT